MHHKTSCWRFHINCKDEFGWRRSERKEEKLEGKEFSIARKIVESRKKITIRQNLIVCASFSLHNPERREKVSGVLLPLPRPVHQLHPSQLSFVGSCFNRISHRLHFLPWFKYIKPNHDQSF